MRGCVSPYSATSCGLSSMTRWSSSVERLLVNPDTAAPSGGAVTGSTICQSVPVFLSVVRSPDSDLMVISSILSASTVKTFSFFSASDGSRFDSTKYR